MNYQIELRHLHYFLVLAEELHFRKAAERLFISQPGLTRQIKQMEEIYKVKLFERGKRVVTLTETGVFLKKEAALLFNHIDNIHRQIEKMAEGKISILRLGFIGSAVQTILPKLLPNLKQKHPLIDITLHEMSNEMQVEWIRKGQLDFGFVRLQDREMGLGVLPLQTEHFVLVLPKGYPLNDFENIDLSDFSTANFILFSKEYSHTYYELVMSIFSDHGFQPKVALRTVNAMSIFNLVSQGVGIAIVPASLSIGYNVDVDFVPLTHIRQRTTLSLIWNNENRNLGVSLFLETIKELTYADIQLQSTIDRFLNE